jgi:glutathione S-transferase
LYDISTLHASPESDKSNIPIFKGAERCRITLTELGLPWEAVEVDLSIPRTPEYLAINPSGQIPTLYYNGNIIAESAIIVQFLAESHPSHLLPSTTDADGPIRRAKLAFFVNQAMTKVSAPFEKTILDIATKGGDVDQQFNDDILKAIVEKMEPLMADFGPFFGGSDRLTLAEVLVGPPLIRQVDLCKLGFATSWYERLPEAAPKFYRWLQAVRKHPTVDACYNEPVNLYFMKAAFLAQWTGSAPSE